MKICNLESFLKALIFSFTFYDVLGFNAPEDHFEIMKLPEYKLFRDDLKEFLDPLKQGRLKGTLDPRKEIEFYHFEFVKDYGDW